MSKSLKSILDQRKDMLDISISTESLGDLEINLFEELHFDPENIQEHVECQASMMAWYNVVSRKAEQELEMAEMEYDVWFTKVYEVEFQRIWKKSNMTKSGKPSKDSVEKAVIACYGEEYKRRQRVLIQTRNRVAILKDSSRWWDEKGRMLVQATKFALSEYGSIGFETMGKGQTQRANDALKRKR